MQPTGETAFRSAAWPEARAEEHAPIAASDSFMAISLAQEARELHDEIHATQWRVVLLAVLVTVAALAVALAVLRRIVQRPLAALKRSILLQQGDRTRLGEPIRVRWS